MANSKQNLAVNTFAFDLLNELFKSEQRNIFFSPLSIFTCMNLALLGARNETEKNLFNGLRCAKSFENVDQVRAYLRALVEHYSKKPDVNASFVNLVNRVLIAKDENDPIVANYANAVRETFNAEVNEVNFIKEKLAIVDSVNNWVKVNTGNMIERLISAEHINVDTIAILLNAIFFKGKWQTEFDKANTQADDFFNNGNESEKKKVQMMYIKKISVTYNAIKVNGEQTQFLCIPYKGGYNLCILLPNALDGVKRISSLNYSEIEYGFERKVELWLPKFKFNSEYELNEILMKLGITNVFTSGADFGGIKKQPIKISKVIHKAAIEVDEEGTKAAAATAIGVMTYSAIPHEKITVKVNRPFIFYIEDAAKNLILFAGKVLTL